jgi:coproporphyrinogen III oxidase
MKFNTFVAMIEKQDIALRFQELQQSICHQLETADGKASFVSDVWQRPGGGGGDSRVIIDGAVIEKGGVNFSEVYGPTPPGILKALSLPQADFFATGVSIVLHPSNPNVPIIHMNVRYFEMDSGHWWFGGGIDLTPHYVRENDARHFHESLKKVCDAHPAADYAAYKTWADDYFYLPHREETRGIGGIFFDRLTGNRDELFEFVMDVGKAFAPLYVHYMNQHRDAPYGEREKHWQLVRRGRYVEFNLVWDKGTKFGLDTNGRTESILMSLPPLASWHYDYRPEPDTAEAATLAHLKKGINWI